MKREKQLLLDELTDQIANYKSFVVMSYSKLSANKANEFRKSVSKIGGTVEVMRKRLLVKAAAAAGLDLKFTLPGHIGVVYAAQDPLEMTKMVLKFSQDNDEAIDLIAGRFDGILYNGDDVEKLSKLPSKPEMRAQFLATLEAPMSQTLAVMDALLTSVMHCLENKSKQSE